MFTKSLLDDALNQLNHKEHLEALELKAQIKLFEQDKQDWFWTGFMTAAYHQYLILAIPADQPHRF